MPPPLLVPALLPEMTQLAMVRLPCPYWIPPPGVLVAAPSTELPLMAQSWSTVVSAGWPLTEPPIRPPPPYSAVLPPVTVTPLMPTVTPPTVAGSRLKTRLPDAWIVVAPAPAPLSWIESPDKVPTRSSPSARL